VPKRLCEISAEPPDAIILPKKKYVLYWKAFEVKTALPNYVDEKVSIAMCITAGQRNSRRPARNVYPVIQYARPLDKLNTDRLSATRYIMDIFEQVPADELINSSDKGQIISQLAYKSELRG